MLCLEDNKNSFTLMNGYYSENVDRNQILEGAV